MTAGSVIIIVADGLGAGAFERALATGSYPALSHLRDDGGAYTLTTSFPSVTGVAYVPLLTGVLPGDAGIPGLRWYDRARGLPAWLGHSRSYVGLQVRQIDRDLSPGVPTAWEVAGPGSLGMFAMLTRGLPARQQVDRGVEVTVRGIAAHLGGDVAGWHALERQLADRFVDRVRRERPRLAFAAIASGDKACHAEGAEGPGSRRALALVDEMVARLRSDAERDGRWPTTDLWVVSDHGHSTVSSHLDVAAVLREHGVRVRSHPWTVPNGSECAVMVSGNSMAHVYVDLGDVARRPWPHRAGGWSERLRPVLDHPAVDLAATLEDAHSRVVRIHKQACGSALVLQAGDRFSYQPLDGDPLGLGPIEHATPEEAHERSIRTEYPDALVQLASLVPAARSGDVVLSASRGWDLRTAWEPIAHVSSHGALHRDHMLVPLVANRVPTTVPRRTQDLFPWMRRVLGR